MKNKLILIPVFVSLFFLVILAQYQSRIAPASIVHADSDGGSDGFDAGCGSGCIVTYPTGFTYSCDANGDNKITGVFSYDFSSWLVSPGSPYACTGVFALLTSAGNVLGSGSGSCSDSIVMTGLPPGVSAQAEVFIDTYGPDGRYGGGNYDTSIPNLSCAPPPPVLPPINGSCAATHYSCAAGTSGNNALSSSAYTWTCSGSNGGTTASCSEAVSSGPATGWINITPNPCTIPAGASTCTTALTWGSTNAPNACIYDNGVLKSCSPSTFGSSPWWPNWITPAGDTWVLRVANDPNSEILSSVKVTGQCAAGTSWDTTSGTCKAAATTALPPPTSMTATCNSGTSATLSWTNMSSYGATDYYPRLYVPAGASCPSGWTMWTDGHTCYINNYKSTSATVSISPNTDYAAWVHDGNPNPPTDPSTGGWYVTAASPKPFSCSNAPTSCSNGLNISQYPSCSCPSGYVQNGSICTPAPGNPVTTTPPPTTSSCVIGTSCIVSNSCGQFSTGTYSASCACSATPPPDSSCLPDVPTLHLSVDPVRVRTGDSTALTWSSAGADSCELVGQNGFHSSNPSGDAVSSGPITARTIFTLTCKNAGGSNSESQFVDVLPRTIEH